MIARTLTTIAICGALGIALGVGLTAYALDRAARAVRGPGRTVARADVPQRATWQHEEVEA